ncbi:MULTISPECIES: helix-turn-helix domain-containing protein [Microbulbifer]|nr:MULTISPECIES: helix-turn-helix transcriptional regulator [Microbulbifer]KUJ82443.1 hypothetical protein AVO43_11545 [Microbulbifer sp. ZGT114]
MELSLAQTPTNERIGQNIKHVREEIYGMTQEQVARKVGVSKNAWSKYETGEVSPKLETLLKFLRLQPNFTVAPGIITSDYIEKDSPYYIIAVCLITEYLSRRNGAFLTVWAQHILSDLIWQANSMALNREVDEMMGAVRRLRGPSAKEFLSTMSTIGLADYGEISKPRESATKKSPKKSG